MALKEIAKVDDVVLKTLFDAYTILYADTDNTPAALSVAASRIIGRKSTGGIAALSATDIFTILGITASASEINTLDGILATVTELNYVDGVTSAIQTQLDAKVAKSLFDAYSILYADTDNTPAALAIAASRIVGRKSSGGVAALTAAEVRTIINVEDGATKYPDTGEQAFLDADHTKLDGIESGAEVNDYASVAEINTGTEASKANSPDALAGSNFGVRYIQMVAFEFATDIATGDGKFYLHIPPALNGMNLVYCHAEVVTAGTTGTTDIQIHNLTDTVDMLSTKLTIDSAETGSDTAATAYVIDTTNDDIATNDVIRLDVDAVSTTAPKGLIVTLGFQLP